MKALLTTVQFELLLVARPGIAPYPHLKYDLDFVLAKGPLATRPDGTLQRSVAGQSRVRAELDAAGCERREF
jgi:hypothetical protein